MSKLKLLTMLGDYPNTLALKNGSVFAHEVTASGSRRSAPSIVSVAAR